MWVTFACGGTGPADESKRTKRVQGWSPLTWLRGILIIVSLLSYETRPGMVLSKLVGWYNHYCFLAYSF